MRAAQIGQFAARLPAGFEFFAGRCIRWGFTTRTDLPVDEADCLAYAIASGGLRIPGFSKRVRAVCRSGFIYYLVEDTEDEPALPADWMTSCEVDGAHLHSPRWVGRQRLAFEQRVLAERVGAPAPWLDELDWSRYEPRTLGWKMIDSPPLPEAFGGVVQEFNL